MARIVVPIADLRREPIDLPKTFDHHPLRDSQLLFNEEIEILEKKGDWVRVAALKQPRFKMGWHPYEGWVHLSEIDEKKMPGSHPLFQNINRQQLVEEAREFVGVPYLWGGLSSEGIDCSGLIHLLYRAQGVTIPRDAHDQFLYGQRVEKLLPGDPLYLAKNRRINHVILFLEKGLFIEAPETGKQVRLLRLDQDIWIDEERRWHFKDRPHPYRGFPITLDIA